MEHSIITMIGPKDWISSMGKETSNTSFSVRALKKDDRIVTILSPSKYPEKIWSLLFSLSLTDRVLLEIEKIDRDLGEILIAIDLMKIEKGMYHLSDMVDRSQFSALIQGTVIERWEQMDPDPSTLREFITGMRNEWDNDMVAVVIDQAFPVKGVGTVALGFVISGAVKKHQSLVTCPGAKRTQVRSIQIHDKDNEEAKAGARVGLAMKNIDPEDMPRGTVLIEDGSELKEYSRLKLSLILSPFWKEPIADGMHLHIGSSLQFLPVTIDRIMGEKEVDGIKVIDVEATPESPVWAGPDSRFTLAFLDSKSFRVFGAGEII